MLKKIKEKIKSINKTIFYCLLCLFVAIIFDLLSMLKIDSSITDIFAFLRIYFTICSTIFYGKHMGSKCQ